MPYKIIGSDSREYGPVDTRRDPRMDRRGPGRRTNNAASVMVDGSHWIRAASDLPGTSRAHVLGRQAKPGAKPHAATGQLPRPLADSTAPSAAVRPLGMAAAILLGVCRPGTILVQGQQGRHRRRRRPQASKANAAGTASLWAYRVKCLARPHLANQHAASINRILQGMQ